MSGAPSGDQLNQRDEFAEMMLARHAESFDIARSLAAMSERFVTSIQMDPGDVHQVIPTCLLIRQVSGLRALCLLVANGFYTEALAHQRSLMEALARLTALANEPNLIDEYLIQDVLNTHKLIDDIIAFRSDWTPDIPREPSDEDLRKMQREGQPHIDSFMEKHHRKPRDIKTFDWAQKGKVTHLLLGRFVIASEALHFSPRSLNSLLLTEGDQIKGIRIGPEDRDIAHLLLSSCKYVFVGVQSLANSRGVIVPDEIEQLFKHFSAVYEKKAEEALQAT